MATVTRITNKGGRAQAIPMVGGSITVRPGRTVETAEKLRVDDMIEHFKALGVTFSSGKEKTGKKAEAGGAKDEVALAEAEKAVADAEAAVTVAGDDLAKKAEAEKALEAAQAALAALKA